MFSDIDIIRAIQNKALEITPFNRLMIQPASIDLRLDNKFLTFNNHLYDCIDPSIEQSELTSKVTIDEKTPFILHPGEFALGSTYETVGFGSLLAGQLNGKSSYGRLGLVIHSTAGFIDPGFRGNITLELSNSATLPIKLWYGMKIGQLCVYRLDSMPAMAYGDDKLDSKYQEQTGPTASKSWKNWNVDLGER